MLFPYLHIGGFSHVVSPSLLETFLVFPRGSLNGEAGGEYVAELRSVSVPAASDLLLIVVVVRRGQQMTKDHRWNVHLLLLVHGHRNALAVVPHGHHIALRIDVDLNGVHALVSLLVICRIHKNLVEYLVEAGHERDLLLHHAVLGVVIHPHQLLGELHGSDVRVGSQQDVLQLRLLLVHLFDGQGLVSVLHDASVAVL